MKEGRDVYGQKIAAFSAQEQQLKKRRSGIAWARFAIMLAIGFWIYAQHHSDWPVIAAGIVVGLVLFLVLVAKDADLRDQLQLVRTLLSINREEIRGLDNDYSHWPDGARYQDAEHAYQGDLDIFGTHSLFQYVNRCSSEGGQDLLAGYFSEAADKTTIEERQQAVKILSGQTDWRQQYQAYGQLAQVKKTLESDIAIWMRLPLVYTSGFWKAFIWIYPLLTLATVYAYLDDRISGGAFGLALTVFLLFAFSLSRKVQGSFEMISRFYPRISSIAALVASLESMEVKDSWLLQQLQESLSGSSTATASRSLQGLGKIAKSFEARLNVFLFVLLNTFLLWDVRVNIRLNDWKKQYGANMPAWLHAIYQGEAYSSLATLSFNHSHWQFPRISENYFELEGVEIGHPLIPEEKRVDNSFSISGQGKIALITGSNMGGKSTFLRSIGVNMVLAYAGAPVCARHFTVSLSRLMSSMRIADNLAENTSTFYAELKKIRAIIDAVRAGENVFILLDEILRGTNSLDRHAGSKALMLQLIRQKVVAVIATHDVELADLVEEYPQAITNYHFDVEVDAKDQLYFDYKLKTGVCQRMNAAILMKQIGIEM